MRRPRKRGKNGGGKLDYELKKLTRQLLAQLKVPHHEAPGEAEAECARMQALGIVDAVWSDDGDSFMFGCGTLVKQHKQGNSNVKDHVRIYHAADILPKHDMDRESLVLFAVLAGGDYVQKGLPECGPKTAALLCKRQFGLASALCRADKRGLVKWRQDLEATLRACRKSVDVPWDFPDAKALGNYREPKISEDAALRDLRGLRNGWDRQIDQQQLRVFLRHKFNFTTREFLKHIAPILVARWLARVAPENRAENLELGIQLKRRRKVKIKEGEEEPPAKSEVKVWFSPLSVVEINLISCSPEEDWSKFAAKDGTPYDPTQPIECELLECLLKHGLPEDALVEAPPPKRARKRNADEPDDAGGSPASKKQRSSQPQGQESSPTAARKKHSRPRKDGTTDAAKPKSGSKKKKGGVAAAERSPSPPPATFQLPTGLAQLRATARVVNLCADGEDDSSSDGSDDADGDSDLARAIQLSLMDTAGPNTSTAGSSLGAGRAYAATVAPPSSFSEATLPASFRGVAAPEAAKSVETLLSPRPAVVAARPPRGTTTPKPMQTLVPGEAISARALRELRAGSLLLRGGGHQSTVAASPTAKAVASAASTKPPEVIDLT